MSNDIFNNFLLTNIPVSLIPPVNHSIVQNMKHYTRRDFMKFMHCVGIGKILQSHNNKDSIFNAAHA